ncbi:Major facilitator superfamily protein [Rhodanobacter sp. Root179]|uniref:MFS transporter n=1 Tax=unclassified Rhodanobacter TaxID=2621553 RepID=UPI0006F61917|nr:MULTISPECIES: MFS transporter [unclassified Rhodanobacter]KRB42636.1 MFS transporter [Rhodanobacter sp. Root179]QRP62999.1 MFS transporter [Rhodanobacter sp. FDAARGOS 1247]
MNDGTSANSKPALSFWQIWNMCFGFLGLQFGFALQNANVSRIFQTLGADLNDIPALWIAAPLTGLIVQPIIGHFSDRTWNRLGRRRPYFLAGAVFASLALLWMPNAPVLWMAAGLLWILDASINVSMEPFRAFVGDQLPTRQRPSGYAMQSFFIGVGAVVASALPWILAQFGVANVAPDGGIPDTVKYAFYAGGAVLLGAVLWTIFSTREYPPDRLQSFSDSVAEPPAVDVSQAWRWGVLLLVVGVAVLFAIQHFALEKEVYVLGGGLLVFGLLFVWLSFSRGRGMLREVMGDLYGMPVSMRQLAWVQLFSWFALFAMWIYTTASVTETIYGTTDVHSALYNEGANWVGVLFAAYNGFAAVAAVVIPLMVRRWGLRISHLINLCLGGAGLLSFLLIRDPVWLLASMVGVGFAWASILSLPYALLSDNLPAGKMGVYMGIFNFFIVIPQLLAASVLGLLLRLCFHNQPIWALALGGACLLVAGLFTLRVREPG